MSEDKHPYLNLRLDTSGSMLPDSIDFPFITVAGGTDIPRAFRDVMLCVPEPRPMIMLTDRDFSGTMDIAEMESVVEAVSKVSVNHIIMLSDMHGIPPGYVTFNDGYKVSHGKFGYGKSWHSNKFGQVDETVPTKATYSHKRKQRAMRKNRK